MKGNGKELIIIGIDNAFTVDNDVKAWPGLMELKTLISIKI